MAPTEQLFEEYKKAIPDLTISKEWKLKQERVMVDICLSMIE